MAKTPSLKLVRPVTRASSEAVRGPAASLSAVERGSVQEALALAELFYPNVMLASGEPALDHAMGTLEIVSELKLDGEALAAALLAPAVRLDAGRLRQVRERCGPVVAELVDGVTRMEQIHALSSRPLSALSSEQAAQLEALRKMLLAMVQDIRVVLVKLAAHTQELRYLARSGVAGAKRDTAQLTQDIFAPLANRLGVWQLKWEMEDLAFRILEPDTYKGLARQLDEKRTGRERYIDAVIAQLKGELNRAGIAAEVSGRPKHIFSIYKKMKSKAIDFESLYDVRAVRILVQDVRDRYAALGLVHNLWTPIPREFDDYIAKPRATSTGRCIPPWWGRKTKRWRCRFAPTRCTGIRSWASLRTGATRKARAASRATTRKSRGCGTSWSGGTIPETPASWPSAFARACLTTRSTC
jgi:GTP pyrophosphokinase